MVVSAIFVFGRNCFNVFSFVFGRKSSRKHRNSNEVSLTSNRSPIDCWRRRTTVSGPRYSIASNLTWTSLPPPQPFSLPAAAWMSTAGTAHVVWLPGPVVAAAAGVRRVVSFSTENDLNFRFRFGFGPKIIFYFRRIFVFGRKRISHLRSVSNWRHIFSLPLSETSSNCNVATVS